MDEQWARWIAGAEAWWPACLTWTVVAAMAAALAALALRAVRMARGLPGGHAPAEEPEGGAERVRWQSLAWVAAAVLGARVLLYAWAWLVECLYSHSWPTPWQSFGARWVQWDAYHYLKLANQWYTAEGVAGPADHLMLVFFPLFPLLLRGLNAVLGDPLAAATVLNALCSVAAGCLLYDLAARRYGRRVARLAVAYLFLNPFSLFLAAPYPEALFLCLTLAAFSAASRRRYLLAGLFGALSAYTRMLGLIVLGVVLLEGVQHWLEEHRAGESRGKLGRLAVRVALCAAVTGLGFAAYLALNVQMSGAPFTFLEYQRSNWSQQFGSFWNSARTTANAMLQYWHDDSFWGCWLPQAVAMVLVPVLLIAGQKRLPLPWAAYAWAYLFIALAPTWLLSGPRYLMVMAPLPLLQACLTRRRWVHVVSLVIQGVLLMMFTYLYAVQRSVL